jgi:hypothetical protein
VLIPTQWLPSLPPPANGWLPVFYEVTEASGILRQGEYRIDGYRLKARSCLIDGEVVWCDEKGVAAFLGTTAFIQDHIGRVVQPSLPFGEDAEMATNFRWLDTGPA